jgi:hypothetical protein
MRANRGGEESRSAEFRRKIDVFVHSAEGEEHGFTERGKRSTVEGIEANDRSFGPARIARFVAEDLAPKIEEIEGILKAPSGLDGRSQLAESRGTSRSFVLTPLSRRGRFQPPKSPSLLLVQKNRAIRSFGATFARHADF